MRKSSVEKSLKAQLVDLVIQKLFHKHWAALVTAYAHLGDTDYERGLRSRTGRYVFLPLIFNHDYKPAVVGYNLVIPENDDALVKLADSVDNYEYLMNRAKQGITNILNKANTNGQLILLLPDYLLEDVTFSSVASHTSDDTVYVDKCKPALAASYGYLKEVRAYNLIAGL